MMQKEICKVGAYYRLSREDGDKAESESIRNQKAMILDYISRREDLRLVEEYADDGYTGTNFDRPSFQKLIEDCKQGKINCIVVKDLSRLGRNYIETGRYLERIFPFLGVRFIAINDNYDSANSESESDQIVIPFKNLLNDAYCRDISMKVRTQLDVKRKNGQFVGSFAPYGYMRDPENKNHLVIDEYAGKIVAMIFDWRLEGMSNRAIARKLTEMNITPPMEYKLKQGANFSNGFRSKGDMRWDPMTIVRILKNEMYVGTMVQGKSRKVNYKVKKQVALDESEWVKVEGTHEPIISRAIFERVQELALMDTRIKRNTDYTDVLVGFLKCGDCGESMVTRYGYYKGKKYPYYICSTYKREEGCSSHLIRKDILNDAILQSIRMQIDVLADAEKIIQAAGRIPEQNFDVRLIDNQIQELEEQIRRFRNLKDRLYQDMVDGVIDRIEYQDMNERFSERLRVAEATKNELLEKRRQTIEDSRDPYRWLNVFKEHRNITEITRKALLAMVESITVYSKDRIEITFKYAETISNYLQLAESCSIQLKGAEGA